MKYSLKQIVKIIIDITGVSLSQMRMGTNVPKHVNARQSFLLIAKDYGIWNSKQDITEFIHVSKSSLSYAEKVSYKKEIRDITTACILKIEDMNTNNRFEIIHKIELLPMYEKVKIANNLIQSIPKHKRIHITL